MGPYPTVVTPVGSGRKVLVVQTSGYGKYLGKLNVEFDDRGEVVGYRGNPVVLDQTKGEDATLEHLVSLYRGEVDNKMSVEVGEAVAFIDGGRPLCRLEECSFGDLLTDAMAEEMGVEMAFVNSGAIKGSFKAGE